MTWLGKILTFVVLVASVVWMFFTVQAYATRTNWRTAMVKWEKSHADSEASRKAELIRYQSTEAALRSQLANEQARSSDLQKQVANLDGANKKFVADFEAQQKVLEEGDVKAVRLQANIDSALKELDTIRSRNTDLENQTTGLVLKAEEAKREMVRAQNNARLSDMIARDYSKKIEDLNDRLAEGRGSGGLRGPLLDRPPPPVLGNLRGEVERVEGDLVLLSIGLDSGLSKGTVLEIYRLEGGGKYLGTIKISDLYQKQATAVFRPKDPKIPFAQLRPDEMPRKGDLVQPSDKIAGGGIIQR